MSWNKIWRNCLKSIHKNGITVTRKDQTRNIQEILSYDFYSCQPQDRLIFSKNFNLNIFQCIGQFLWITQGNFRLDDIKYYQPKAEKYSDDDMKMIGAYGPRLFGISYLDQINHVIEILKEDSGKRRAIASVYLPQFDQHKKLKAEIPCTLNLQYLIRDDKFHAITYMRSQDAYKVLPYDFFIFTMLQEYIHNVLRVDYLEGKIKEHDGSSNSERDGTRSISEFVHENLGLGKYYHYSGSFHTYKMDEQRIKDTILEEDLVDTHKNMRMPSMPQKDAKPNLIQLNKLEALIRTLTIERNSIKLSFEIDDMLQHIDVSFNDEYWKQLGCLLLTYNVLSSENTDDFSKVYKKLDDVYKYFVNKYVKKNEMSNFFQDIDQI